MRTRTRRGRGKRQDEKQEEALLRRLSRTLSEAEIRRALAGGLLELDASGRDRLVERLGGETGALLRELLDRPHARASRTSTNKVRQQWERAWVDWLSCVDESGYEEGRYAQQDYDWKAPYLDAGRLFEDLEDIATRMTPLIDRVIDDGIDATFSFAAAITQTSADIGAGLPEWMRAEVEEGFGPKVTTCLLQWQWRVGQREGSSAFDVLDGICRLDVSLEQGDLDQKSIATWLRELRKVDQKEIIEGIERQRDGGHWAEILGRPRSSWFQRRKELARLVGSRSTKGKKKSPR